MELQKVIDYCLVKKGAIQEFPFDEETLVCKVLGKMFALISLNKPYSINLKCEPQFAVGLRNEYHGVSAGYHMNKKHWNTILLDSDVSDEKIMELIDHSYEKVIQSLPKARQKSL